MTVPNLLSLLRILLIVPLVWLLTQHQYLMALVLFACASLLDWLDGYVAYRLNQQTLFGAVLDHFADKLLVCSVMITLLYVYPSYVALVATLIVVGRDLLMGGLREFWLQGGAAERSAVNIFGKWKTTIQMLSICLILLVHWQAVDTMSWLVYSAYILVAIVTLLSLVSYLRPAKDKP